MTRSLTGPQGLPRLYLACHPEDLETYREPYGAMLLRRLNCSVWYDRQPEAPFDEELAQALEDMQLFLFPVTERLLTQPSRARDFELRYALEHHIPVLPLIEQPGLRDEYKKVFGSLQSLTPGQQDETADSFEKKLAEFLDRVLGDEQLRERIRDAFDGQVFLSYRKKDRALVRAFMGALRSRPHYQALSLWFDEYLTPGEDFHEGIAGAMRASELVLLAVTPALICEENFVQASEYPMARLAGKTVFPIELAPTDREELARQYQALPEPWQLQDPALWDALDQALRRAGVRFRDPTPERDYLIGMAYLTGAGVEPDRKRGLALIAEAAQAGHIEAVIRLREMYRLNEYVPLDYGQSIRWAQRAADLLQERLVREPTEENCAALMRAARSMGDLARESGDRRAMGAYETMYRAAGLLAERWGSEEGERLQALALGDMGKLLLSAGQAGQALRCFAEAENIFTARHRRLDTVQSAWDLAGICQLEADVYRRAGRLEQAEELYRYAVALFRSKLDSGEAGIARNLAASAASLGALYCSAGAWSQARSCLTESARIYGQLAADGSGRVMVRVARNLCRVLSMLGDIEQAERRPQAAELRYRQAIATAAAALPPDDELIPALGEQLRRLRQKYGGTP